MRSFGLNYEVSLTLLGPEVAEMRKVEDHYRSISKELSSRTGKRSRVRRTGTK